MSGSTVAQIRSVGLCEDHKCGISPVVALCPYLDLWACGHCSQGHIQNLIFTFCTVHNFAKCLTIVIEIHMFWGHLDQNRHASLLITHTMHKHEVNATQWAQWATPAEFTSTAVSTTIMKSACVVMNMNANLHELIQIVYNCTHNTAFSWRLIVKQAHNTIIPTSAGLCLERQSFFNGSQNTVFQNTVFLSRQCPISHIPHHRHPTQSRVPPQRAWGGWVHGEQWGIWDVGHCRNKKTVFWKTVFWNGGCVWLPF